MSNRRFMGRRRFPHNSWFRVRCLSNVFSSWERFANMKMVSKIKLADADFWGRRMRIESVVAYVEVVVPCFGDLVERMASRRVRLALSFIVGARGVIRRREAEGLI